jgi:uncharacterized protein YrrD
MEDVSSSVADVSSIEEACSELPSASCWLVEESWFGGAHVVRWPAVLSVGTDTLVIDSKTSVVKASEVPEMKDVFDRGNVLAGVHVRTTDGLDLGKFQAFYFDETSGRILGYELSGGTGRKKRARSFLPTPASFEAGKDVAFVSPEAGDTIQDLEEALKQRQSPESESVS